jgi:NitT/TauT family transport system substrate-binding protein
MSSHLDRPARNGRHLVKAALSVALALMLAAGLVWVAGCGSSETEVETTVGTEPAPVTTTTTAATAPAVETTIYPDEAIYLTTTSVAKLDKLTLVAPPGPMAIPLAYMAVNDKLADVAAETELVIWENADQLKAMVAGGQGDFVTIPSNNAAIFYNKELKLRLLNISVWNITYLVTTDPDVTSFSDIKGQSLVVSLQGSVPDVMFQYIAMKEGLDPEKDFDLQYVNDPTQAAQFLLAGKVQNAVLSEALATAVLLQTKTAGKPLHRAFAFDKAWAEAAGGSALSTIAGTVATATVMDQPAVVAAFEREYEAAVEWMVANPDEAGQLVETELPELGLKAAVMTTSLKNITWNYTPAAEARASLEAFYAALSELSPAVIGGRLPDDGFYYTP